MRAIVPALLLLLGDPAAGAAVPEPPPADAALTFQFAGCGDDLARDVEQLIRADVSWAPGDPPVALTVRCQEPLITLLLGGDDVRVTERKLDLAATPLEARARTAALVATEPILMGRRSPPPVLPAPTVATTVASGDDAPVVRATAAPTDEEVPRRAASRTGGRSPALLAVVGSSLQGVAGFVPMFDAGARGRLPAGRAFDLAADGVVLYQRRTSAYGTSQALGGELSLLIEARSGFQGGAARLGAGLRVVGLRVAGAPADPTTFGTSAWGSSVGPMGRLSVSGERGHVVGELAFAGGWSGPEVVGTAAGGSPIGVGGWWAGVSVAAGWLSGVN